MTDYPFFVLKKNFKKKKKKGVLYLFEFNILFLNYASEVL